MSTTNLLHYSPPPDEGLAILYSDDALLVVDKPAGLLSVPGRGEEKIDCLARRVQQRFPDARIVHRLDMATSGVMVLARGAPMHRLLSMAFMERKVHKQYIAYVDGLIQKSRHTIDLPLIVDWPNRPRQKVDFENGKEAITHYRVLKRNTAQQYSKVELTPITGRAHQLRMHMLHIGHPILGDDLYAPPSAFHKAQRLMLHAQKLCLRHPITHQEMVFCAPLPFEKEASWLPQPTEQTN